MLAVVLPSSGLLVFAMQLLAGKANQHQPDMPSLLYAPALSTKRRDRIPSLKADKRKGFIYNRSLSVLTWSICMLTVSEVISAYLRIPITSTLAFGGIGGLAIGLAGKV